VKARQTLHLAPALIPRELSKLRRCCLTSRAPKRRRDDKDQERNDASNLDQPNMNSEADMKRELVAIREEKQLNHLRQELQKARAEKTLRLSIGELPIRIRSSDDFHKEKMFKIVDPKGYKGTKPHDLKTFVRECQGAFDIAKPWRSSSRKF
jgi:hypothetical protein